MKESLEKYRVQSFLNDSQLENVELRNSTELRKKRGELDLVYNNCLIIYLIKSNELSLCFFNHFFQEQSREQHKHDLIEKMKENDHRRQMELISAQAAVATQKK